VDRNHLRGDTQEGKHTVDLETTTLERKMLCSVHDVAAMLSIGRTAAWELVRKRTIRCVKIGRIWRVAITAVQEYIGRLLAEEVACWCQRVTKHHRQIGALANGNTAWKDAARRLTLYPRCTLASERILRRVGPELGSKHRSGEELSTLKWYEARIEGGWVELVGRLVPTACCLRIGCVLCTGVRKRSPCLNYSTLVRCHGTSPFALGCLNCCRTVAVMNPMPKGRGLRLTPPSRTGPPRRIR
jgi:excisionase family DNA binding protein